MSPWVRIDDQLHSHPKISDAWSRDPGAIGLYLRALSFAGGYLTDGHVPDTFVEGCFPAPARRAKAVRALTETGLWSRKDGGFQIHDFLDFNDSRAEILEKRARDSARKARGIRKESRGNP